MKHDFLSPDLQLIQFSVEDVVNASATGGLIDGGSSDGGSKDLDDLFPGLGG
ncbi:MAG: hypothetical protein IJP02_02505 [Oscillospiraceae bacterium]|nr:hypothetical protein [Oscillospiraceae bacterium]